MYPPSLNEDDLAMLHCVKLIQPCKASEIVKDWAKYIKMGLIINIKGGLGLGEEAEQLLRDKYYEKG